jgi:predicted phosphodiesterase
VNTHSHLRVGLLSDTHGLLRPEARAFVMGCDYILHGGDVGNAAILEELAAIAPVIAVRGNNDKGPWAARLRDTELIRVGHVFVYIIHNDGILFVNPGSCGRRRFKLPVSVGEILVSGSEVKARTIELDLA